VTINQRVRGRILEAIVIFLAFALVNVASQAFQEPLSYHELVESGVFDAAYYHVMAEQLSLGELPETYAPFVYRIGTPLLVGLLFDDDNLLLGFKVVNLVANALTVILLVHWLRLYLGDWRIRVLLVLLFLTQWHAPVRFLYYYPPFVDPWMFVFLLLGLILTHEVRQRPSWTKPLCLGVLSFVGVVFREVVLVIPLALLFVSNPIVTWAGLLPRLTSLRKLREAIRLPPLAFVVPLGLGFLGLLATHLIATPLPGYSFVLTAIQWAYEKPAPTYLHAWFIAYGPIIAVALYDWRRLSSFLRDNQFMLTYLLSFAVLGWVGGSDTERILYWAMPVVYVLIGKAVEDTFDLIKAWPLATVLILSQLVSQRVFWTLPQYPSDHPTPWPILTVPSSRFQFLDLFSVHAERTIEAVSLVQYMVLCALVLWYMAGSELRNASL
jgi:hypothetical protein